MPTDADLRLHDLAPEARKAALAAISATVAGFQEVRLAYAFGSFVRGERFRDIDIAVLLRDAGAWRVPGRISGACRENLGNPPFEIEVVPLNDAPPSFRRAIAEGGVVLHEQEAGEALSFWVQAASEQMDLAAWRASHDRAA